MSSPLFHLRPFSTDDLPALVKHANDPTVAANLTDAFPHPYTEEAGRNFLTEAAKPVPLRRCIEIGGTNELVTSLLEIESSQWPDNERKRGDYLPST